jgi:uncharacterized OsmC-like protein
VGVTVAATTSIGAGRRAVVRNRAAGQRPNDRTRMSVHRRAIIAPVSLLILALTGCSSAALSAGTTGSTLADTKAVVQLLRNETANRIPREVIGSVISQSDISEPCDAGDPMRLWRSGVRVVLTEERTKDATQTFRNVVESFRANGWKEVRETDQKSILTSTSSMGIVEISARADTSPSSIGIVVTGPCVATAGAGSAEITKLESAG